MGAPAHLLTRDVVLGPRSPTPCTALSEVFLPSVCHEDTDPIDLTACNAFLVGNHEEPLGTIGNHQEPLGTIGNHREPLRTIGNHRGRIAILEGLSTRSFLHSRTYVYQSFRQHVMYRPIGLFLP